MIDELVKNFEQFCILCEGKFSYNVFPQCTKLTYTIRLDFHEIDDTLEYLKIRIISDEGDFEILSLFNVKIENIERKTENDEKGEMNYYVLNIYTNKGLLKLKKELKEDKFIVEFNGKDIKYSSSVLF